MVRFHMALQTALLHEGAIAILARKPPVIIVNPHVLLQSLLPSVLFEADLTLEIPLPTVANHVILQLISAA